MRDEFRPALFHDVMRDVRYGLRTLRRAPAFTLVSSLTLAVSIGAATTVFSEVNGVHIKPLPYRDADALISTWNVPQAAENRDEVPDLGDAVLHLPGRTNRVFAAFGLWSRGAAAVTGLTGPHRGPGAARDLRHRFKRSECRLPLAGGSRGRRRSAFGSSPSFSPNRATGEGIRG